MKRIIVIVTSLLVFGSANAQVFNTGTTLKPKDFSLGVEPAVIINGDADFILFLHGGYGLTKGIDFGLTVGVLGPANYFGADIEFMVHKNMSLAFGAHHFGRFGLDGTFLATFPIKNVVNVFGGLDLDVNISEDTDFLLWFPIGVEVGIRKGMSFIFETQVGLTNPAYHLIGGGVNFYF
ncbi:MAG TPA: hypothetical protein PLY32_05855 [Salinivirgaceae bacterium]|nr:hypothetical protein [Salinivirgaceae bacterium]HQA76627.1 hypothetical protein [Salinivirgaceae bacterium]